MNVFFKIGILGEVGFTRGNSLRGEGRSEYMLMKMGPL